MLLKIQVQIPYEVPFSISATPVAIVETTDALEYILPQGLGVIISDPDSEGDVLARWILTHVRVGLIGAILDGYLAQTGERFCHPCLSFEFFD